MFFLWGERMPIDVALLTQQLFDMRKLVEVGGAVYVTELFISDRIGSAANIDAYLEILDEKHTLRQAMTVCRNYEQQAKKGKASEVLEGIETDLKKIIHRRMNPSRRRGNTGRTAEAIFAKWREGKREELFGVSTGIQSLDALIGGLAPGDLIYISGATSSGKTALAMRIEHHFLWDRKERILDFTYEMTETQKVTRMMQMISRENLRNSMKPQRQLGDKSERNIAISVARLKEMRWEVMDDRSTTMKQACAHARNLHDEAKLSLVVFDYDELIRGERMKGMTREEELATISAMAKTLAGELGCPIIVLSQETEDKDGTVRLRGSGAKKNDANVWIRLETQDDGTKKLTVMKSREGERGGELFFNFNGALTTFTEL